MPQLGDGPISSSSQGQEPQARTETNYPGIEHLRPGRVRFFPESQFRLSDRLPFIRTEEDGSTVLFEQGQFSLAQFPSADRAYVKQEGERDSLLTFSIGPDGKVVEITAMASLETLAVLAQNRELPLSEALQQLLELPEVTPEMVRKVTKEMAEKAERRAEANKTEEDKRARAATLTPDIPRQRDQMAEKEDAIRVLQHEVGITRADRPSRYIETFGGADCIVMTFYDPLTKTGALAHIDGTTNIDDSIDRIIELMQKSGVNPNQLIPSVIGGVKGSERIIIDIFDALARHQLSVADTNRDVLNVTNQTAIIMDTESGRLYNLVPRDGQSFRSEPGDISRSMIATMNPDIRIITDPNGL